MFNIVKGGCSYRHPSSFNLSRPNGFNHYVLLLVKSPCEFHIDNSLMETSAGYAVIISPNTSYSYRNPHGDFVNDWLHFDVDDESFFNDIFPITNSLIPLSNTDICSNILQQIFWENSYSPIEYRQDNIDSLFNVLLHHLLHNHKERDNMHLKGPFYSELCAIRLNLRNALADEHCIKKYADELHISPSYFQHLYTNLFGISFQKDLIQARIDYAKTLLRSSDMPIAHIANICGYNNEVHFYRQFKDVTFCTPTAYRRKRQYTN